MELKYSRLDAGKYLLKDGFKRNTKAMYLMLLEAIMESITTIAESLLSSFVLMILTASYLDSLKIKYIIYACIIFGIIETITAFLVRRNWAQYISWRCSFWTYFINKSQLADYQFYQREDTQTKLNKGERSLNSNGSGAEGFMHQFHFVLTCILNLIVNSIILSSMNVYIILILLSLSIITYFINNKFNEKFNKSLYASSNNEIHLKYYSNLAEDVNAGKDIRLYQMSDMLDEYYDSANKVAKQLELNSQKYNMYSNLLTNVVTFIRDVIVYAYLIRQMINGNIEVGMFALYINSLLCFSNSFLKLSSYMSELNLSLDLFRNTLEAFDILENSFKGDIPFKDSIKEIKFDHVSFKYPNSDCLILDDFNLTIKDNEKLALVGLNGAGKSTLVKLLCKFYHPTSGRILINGINLEDIKDKDYFKQVGAVFQESKLLSYTVGENITGELEGNYNNDNLYKALEIAGIKEKIINLKNKTATFVNKDIDDDGVNFSGGEVQKILLARAYLHNPSLLILDEPTAALDAICEQDIYTSYNKIAKDKLSIFISHRLASTKFCDRIILIENGKIKEEGSHDELIKLKGSYYDLFNIQSKYYKETFNEEL